MSKIKPIPSEGNPSFPESPAAVQTAVDDLAKELESPALVSLVRECPELFSAIVEARNQARTPFRVAVSGEVSAGKSSFVNAFLGWDLALTDVVECTAVGSEFFFGEPPDSTHPVKAVFRDGHSEWVGLDYRDGLKGASQEALQRAECISHLAFPVRKNVLSNLVLVDTPGLNSVVSAHEASARGTLGRRTDNLKERLAERNDWETREAALAADAVLWISSENVLARTCRHLSAFLKDTVSGSAPSSQRLTAFNVMVVLTKADVQATRAERCRRMEDAARQLNASLPCNVRLFVVSAATERLLQRLGTPGLARLRDALQRECPTEASLKQLLKKGHPAEYSPDEWSAIRSGINRGALERVLAILHGAPTINEAVGELRDLSGFDALRVALARHFASESAVIKSRMVLSKCLRALHRLSQEGLEQARRRVAAHRKEFAAFARFVRSHPDYRDPHEDGYGGRETGWKLIKFLESQTPVDSTEEAKRLLEASRATFDTLHRAMCRSWIRLDGLTALQAAWSQLSEAERTELETVFRATEAPPRTQCESRARHWGHRTYHDMEPSPAVRAVAALAKAVYLEWLDS